MARSILRMLIISAQKTWQTVLASPIGLHWPTPYPENQNMNISGLSYLLSSSFTPPLSAHLYLHTIHDSKLTTNSTFQFQLSTHRFSHATKSLRQQKLPLARKYTFYHTSHFQTPPQPHRNDRIRVPRLGLTR